MTEPDEQPSGSDLEPATGETVEVDDAEVVDGEEVDPAGEEPGGIHLEFTHVGPMPAHQWLEAVEPLAPGTTEKLVDDFVKQKEHRREIDKAAFRLDEKSFDDYSSFQVRQLYLAGLIAILFFVGGVVLILLDKEVYGLAVLVAEIAAVVTAIYKRNRAETSPAPDLDPEEAAAEESP